MFNRMICTNTCETRLRCCIIDDMIDVSHSVNLCYTQRNWMMSPQNQTPISPMWAELNAGVIVQDHLPNVQIATRAHNWVSRANRKSRGQKYPDTTLNQQPITTTATELSHIRRTCFVRIIHTTWRNGMGSADQLGGEQKKNQQLVRQLARSECEQTGFSLLTVYCNIVRRVSISRPAVKINLSRIWILRSCSWTNWV